MYGADILGGFSGVTYPDSKTGNDIHYTVSGSCIKLYTSKDRVRYIPQLYTQKNEFLVYTYSNINTDSLYRTDTCTTAVYVMNTFNKTKGELN